MALDPTKTMVTLVDAESYFESKVEAEGWECVEDISEGLTADDQKLRALIDATRRISQLRFKGCKADPTQEHPFPRGTDTTVPLDIQYAVCELANALLDGVNDELENENTRLTSHSFSGVRTTYDVSSPPAHIFTGILSIQAWRYLVPYLRDPRQLNIVRA